MNNFDLLDAIGGVNDQWKQEVITHMTKNNNTNTAGRYARKPSTARRILRQLPVAAAIICLLGVTAYAAATHWGIFDFQRESLRPFPSEAQEIVQQQTETGSIVQEDETGSTELIKCEITESVNDGRQLNLTVRLQSGVPGKYVLLNQMDEPGMAASYFGADYDGTIGEYAEENGMTLLEVSAGVQFTENGQGSGVQTVQEKHQAPDTIDYLITCDMADLPASGEGILVTTAREFDKVNFEDIIRTEIPFSFLETANSQSESYRPVNQPNVEGVEITDVNVSHTDLRTYIEITYKMPQKLLDEGAMFRFSPDGEYGTASAGSYTEELEPGLYKHNEEMSKTDLGDSFTMEFFSLWGPEGKTVLDTVEFVK
ncbi:MAG: hypothetical protein Q4F17_11685 [Eubacteriales bacterium]|nr:hypothetical protein [Eubacteriales bacterium]